MKIDLSWVKRLNFKTIGIILAVVLLVGLFFWGKSCITAPTRAAYQAGVADGKAEVYEKKVKPLAEDHARALAENATLKKDIKGVTAENERLKGIQATYSVTLTSLEAVRRTLTDKDAIIANLDQQIVVHKQNEAVWEDRYSGEHGLRLKLQGDYDALMVAYEKVYQHDQAGADALRAMTLDRDLYQKAASASAWKVKGAVAVVAVVAGYFGGKALKVW